MGVNVFYRYSDKGNPFGRVIGKNDAWFNKLTRRDCLHNFVRSFDPKIITMFADNVEDTTAEFLRAYCGSMYRTSLGNTNGFLLAYNTAIDSLDRDDIVYFVEDDYLHVPGCYSKLIEGLQIADYVTLYDHLDKYIDGGNNPLIRGGGEDSKVFVTNSTHWKLTNATTMTFAARVSTLIADMDIIKGACQPHFPHPLDFMMFRTLIEHRGRRLISPIPGLSSHVGHEMSPFVDWQALSGLPVEVA